LHAMGLPLHVKLRQDAQPIEPARLRASRLRSL
jgi:hypothetical protein